MGNKISKLFREESYVICRECNDSLKIRNDELEIIDEYYSSNDIGVYGCLTFRCSNAHIYKISSYSVKRIDMMRQHNLYVKEEKISKINNITKNKYTQ